MQPPLPRSLYVAFDVYPRPKGSSSHITSMIEALAHDFAPVRVLCLGDGSLPAVERPAPGIEIHRASFPHLRDMLDRASAFARFVEGHASGIAASLELVVFRDPWGGVPAMRATAAACPAIFEVNALPSWELEYWRPGFSANVTLGAKVGDLERECLRKAASVLCVSDVTMRALVQQEGVAAERIHVIANSAADVFFAAPPEEVAPGTFAYVGGLQPWQGVEDLIDAFALMAGGVPEAKMLIAHSGNRSTRELERRIARHGLTARVVWPEVPFTTAELASLLPRLRFTVAPLADTSRNTLQGCCPVKIIESMAAGTPVLASDLAVSRELITHGEDGWLVPAGNARAWAAAMELLLTDSQLTERLAAGAKATAIQRFGRTGIHEKLRSVFQACARGYTV